MSEVRGQEPSFLLRCILANPVRTPLVPAGRPTRRAAQVTGTQYTVAPSLCSAKSPGSALLQEEDGRPLGRRGRAVPTFQCFRVLGAPCARVWPRSSGQRPQCTSSRTRKADTEGSRVVRAPLLTSSSSSSERWKPPATVPAPGHADCTPPGVSSRLPLQTRAAQLTEGRARAAWPGGLA